MDEQNIPPAQRENRRYSNLFQPPKAHLPNLRNWQREDHDIRKDRQPGIQSPTNDIRPTMAREIRLPFLLHRDTGEDDHEDEHDDSGNDKRGDPVCDPSQGAGGLKGDLEQAVVEKQDGNLGEGDVAGV